jgi:outer membrane protein OmpA-like peptidoglycan-associated protein
MAVVALGLGGCATKQYVDEQVGGVGARVAEQGTRLDGVDATAREALQRATAAGKLAEGKFLYSVVMSDDALKFPVGKATLSPEAQQRLTALAERLKAENKNVYVEVQGHTDDSGSPEGNLRLGEQRAEAVRLFLNKQGVPLNRLATISYGEEAPTAPNTTREGRAANRRVVLVVLS